MTRIIEKDNCYKITGLCFKVQKKLGRFCRERQYCDEFEALLIQQNLPYKREYELKELNQDSPNGNKVDFLVFGKVLVDFKAKNYITKEDYYQMLRYLSAARLEIGLIVNFRDSHLKPKRVLNNNLHSDNSGLNSEHSGRILGIDYGEKRIGLAISDESQTFARELAILSPKEFWQQLKTIISENQINKIVLGWPLNMSGEETKKTLEVNDFKEKLEKLVEIQIEIIDERLTSQMAQNISGGKKDLDSLAAQILLQNYLDKNRK